MSWQAYVDTQLAAAGTLTHAAILSNTDASVWGMTPDFQPRGYEADIMNDDGTESKQAVNESVNLVKIISTGRNVPQGLRFNGVKYQFIRGETDPNVIIQGKKGKMGLILSKTGQAIIVGVYNEEADQRSGDAMMTIERLADYLRDNGC